MLALSLMGAVAALGATLVQGESANVPVGIERTSAQSELEEPQQENVSNRRVIDPDNWSNFFPYEYRTISGYLNNKDNPNYGKAIIPLKRMCHPDYGGDGYGGVPSGKNRPSARYISNHILHQEKSSLDKNFGSNCIWQWGQFIDHDVTEVPVPSVEKESMPIPIPDDDPHFTITEMDMTRSDFEVDPEGYRQQVNEITCWIDGSMVYGHETERAEHLRMHDGSGMLKTSESEHGPMPPYNTEHLRNADTPHFPKESFHICGDVRANEQHNLLAMHTLWVREHNFWCHQIKYADPSLSGDEIYEMARVLVVAIIQKITYWDWLPLLVGPLPKYTGYDKTIQPDMTNEFATAAFRVGHTMLSSDLFRMTKCDEKDPEGHTSLVESFFNPKGLTEKGLEHNFRGMAKQLMEDIDNKVVDEVRNMLFDHPDEAHAFDLPALNIQRGRDHGLPGYNAMRTCYGLAPKTWDDFDAYDPSVTPKLKQVYGSLDDCDPWVCMLCENHMPGARVGELIQKIMMEEFMKLRDGDRFYWETYLSEELQALVKATTLSDVIKRNTRLTKYTIQDDVFHVPYTSHKDVKW